MFWKIPKAFQSQRWCSPATSCHHFKVMIKNVFKHGSQGCRAGGQGLAGALHLSRTPKAYGPPWPWDPIMVCTGAVGMHLPTSGWDIFGDLKKRNKCQWQYGATFTGATFSVPDTFPGRSYQSWRNGFQGQRMRHSCSSQSNHSAWKR